MKDKRMHILEEATIPNAVMTMALPSIIGLLVMAIYNIVDTMFVAWLGTQATGATQIVFPLIMSLGAVGLAFGIGGSSYVSRLLEEKNMKMAEEVVSTNFFMALGTGVVITIAGLLFIEPILHMFGATESMMTMAREYGIFIMMGAVPQIINMTLNNLLRAEGSAKYSMIAMASGAVLNIILDPILIFTFDLGIKGAAIATSFSQLVTSILLISQYVQGKSLLRIHLSYVSFDRTLLTEVGKMGCPSFARQILMSISMGLINQSAGLYGGDSAIAAMGIVTRTMMIIMYVIFGLSQGFQPVAGFNFGSRSRERLMESLKFTIKVSMVFATVSSGLFLLLNDAILSIYKPSNDVLGLAKEFSPYFAFSMVLVSYTNVIGVYYQAIGRSLPALVLSIARQGLFLIPIIMFLSPLLGLKGVYLAQPIADVLTLFATVTLYLYTRNSINNELSIKNLYIAKTK
jgi:putative MATE family efflux protein